MNKIMRTIFQSRDVKNNPDFDVAFETPVILAFPTAVTTGNVAVLTEAGNTVVLPVDIINQLIPRVKMIKSAGTTVAPTDIYIGWI